MIENCTGNIKTKWPESTNSYYTTENDENIIYVNSNLGNYPSNAYNVEIEGDMKAGSSWGGLRFAGQDNTVYVLLKHSSNGNEGVINYSIPTSEYKHFKVIFEDNTATLYINGDLIDSKTISRTTKIKFYGGSATNYFKLKNITIKRL